jgi:hypothetical protein
VANGLPKAMRVITGLMLMTAFVLIAWAVITRYAGGWGVPYFSFQTDRGSSCRNNLTGYTCTKLTLADVEFYGDVELPAASRVLDGTYHATHDYQLQARLVVPKVDAAAAMRGLTESFGRCQPSHPAPMPTAGLINICVLANDDEAITSDGELSGRLFSVGTGLRKDGIRTIFLSVRSR